MQSMVKARKSAWSTVKTSKRTGQSFDLAVAAVTIESMGVTPPCYGDGRIGDLLPIKAEL